MSYCYAQESELEKVMKNVSGCTSSLDGSDLTQSQRARLMDLFPRNIIAIDELQPGWQSDEDMNALINSGYLEMIGNYLHVTDGVNRDEVIAKFQEPNNVERIKSLQRS